QARRRPPERTQGGGKYKGLDHASYSGWQAGLARILDKYELYSLGTSRQIQRERVFDRPGGGGSPKGWPTAQNANGPCGSGGAALRLDCLRAHPFSARLRAKQADVIGGGSARWQNSSPE